MLGTCWQLARADVDPARAIEAAELSRTLDPGLIAALDAKPALAARAALAVGRTKRPDGVAPLRAHLAAQDAGVRAMCAYGLGLLADATALDDLRGLARRDAASAVRYAAVDAVGRTVAAHPALATREVAGDLLIVARADADPIVRAHAAAQLDVFRGVPFAVDLARSLEHLTERDPDPRVRWHAAWTIARAFAPAADAAFLKRALTDPNELVRVEAARAWGRRTDPDAAKIVAGAAADTSWRVQLEVREALLRLAKKPPTEHLASLPPDLHVPAIPALPAADAGLVTPPPSPLPSASPYTAPDSATLALAVPFAPKTAAEMNGPQPGPHPRALIRTTKGDVTVTLYPEWAPSTVANFATLATRRYFDGNRWFRIVPDFVVQTGDPTDNGEGDAGYRIPAEENPVEQRAGVIAMGLNYDKNLPERDSAGTQFYVTLSPQLHLDRDFSVFGEITSGFDVLAHLIESDRIVAVTMLPAR